MCILWLTISFLLNRQKYNYCFQAFSVTNYFFRWNLRRPREYQMVVPVQLPVSDVTYTLMQKAKSYINIKDLLSFVLWVYGTE